jgi:hypothetical protein
VMEVDTNPSDPASAYLWYQTSVPEIRKTGAFHLCSHAGPGGYWVLRDVGR